MTKPNPPAGESGFPLPPAFHPEFRLFLAAEEVFFGPGPFRLLGLIRQKGSLQLACGEMGMSYSKGWKMLQNIENQLGCRLIERSRGGSQHGCSALTTEGLDLLEKYGRFCQECTKQVNASFQAVFGVSPE